MRAHRLGSRRGRGVVQFIAFSLGFFLQAGPVVAQVGTGVIEGRVTDETDAVLPGVTVTISSPALQLPQMVDVTEPTDGFGSSTSRLASTACSTCLAGFQTVVREDVRLNAGFVARLDAIDEGRRASKNR